MRANHYGCSYVFRIDPGCCKCRCEAAHHASGVWKRVYGKGAGMSALAHPSKARSRDLAPLAAPMI